MTICLEYLIRNRIVEEMVDYPLSLFLEGTERVAVTFDRKGNTKLLVRRWFLDKIDTKHALPPCDEFVIKSTKVFTDARIVMDGFRPLQYVEEPVESGLNAPRRPIEPEIYHHYATNLLNSGFHRSVKEDFLWTAFYNVYMEPFIEKHPSWDEFDLGFQKMQAKDFARKDKYLWTHWLLWKRVMMPESLQRADERGVAGELAFTPSYQDLYLAQAASHHGSDCSSKHTSKKQSSAPSVDTLSA